MRVSSGPFIPTPDEVSAAWLSEQLRAAGHEWLNRPSPRYAAANHHRYRTLLPGFLDRYGDRL